MSETRLKEFEALRGLSILLLLALHSEIFDPYVFGQALKDIGFFVASFLLGSFFFLAGYFTEVSLSKPGINVFRFVWSKFIRIYPPYWLALFLFVFVLEYDLNRTALAVYVMNLQAVFSPVFIKALLTLWYISMLVVFYILIGGVMLFVRSSLGLLIIAIAIFVSAFALHRLWGFFDPRFFQYYFIFLAGVYFCRFESWRKRLFEWNIIFKATLAILSVVLMQLTLNMGLPPTNLIYLLVSDFFILCWILLVLTGFRTKVGGWGIWGWLSTASFFAYLIHRPLWRVIDNYFELEPELRTVMIHLMPGAIAALILGYFLQRGYDRLLFTLRLK